MKDCWYFFLIVILLSIPFKKVIGSSILENDSNTSIIINKKKGYSPSRTALLSAVLPGAGQFANKQYIKPPVIYVALIGVGYMIYNFNSEYYRYRTAYKLRVDNDSTTLDEFSPKNLKVNPSNYIYNDAQILAIREDQKRYRDLSIILMAVVYTANIVDAYVYAHLKEFNVSDDLSLKIKPLQIGYNPFSTNNFSITSGLTLSLRK